MQFEYGSPFSGFAKEELKRFLKRSMLDYDENIEYTINFLEDDEIIATGSLDRNVLKCIAVSQNHQGENLTAPLLSQLKQEAFCRGYEHLFLYTKPQNQQLFENLDFYAVAKTDDMLLMENRKNGVSSFVDSLVAPNNGVIGCIVANCNPFTKGHRYLIETAASACDWLHLFVLSEDRSLVPACDRFELVKAGVADLKNVLVHPSSDYLISSASFPTYFLKEKETIPAVTCRLDLEIFVQNFAKRLHITKRFVGTEPTCAVTGAYNKEMKQILPKHGIDVIEIPRLESCGTAISASTVRRLWKDEQWDKLAEFVPETTLSYLKSHGELVK